MLEKTLEMNIIMSQNITLNGVRGQFQYVFRLLTNENIIVCLKL